MLSVNSPAFTRKRCVCSLWLSCGWQFQSCSQESNSFSALWNNAVIVVCLCVFRLKLYCVSFCLPDGGFKSVVRRMHTVVQKTGSIGCQMLPVHGNMWSRKPPLTQRQTCSWVHREQERICAQSFFVTLQDSTGQKWHIKIDLYISSSVLPKYQ